MGPGMECHGFHFVGLATKASRKAPRVSLVDLQPSHGPSVFQNVPLRAYVFRHKPYILMRLFL